MEGKVIGGTEKCIVCLKAAELYTGHVRKGNDIVFAGWCREHGETNLFDQKGNVAFMAGIPGCHGGWIEEYGLEERNK